MKVPASFAVGAASHAGRVRLVNEDDYLLGAVLPPAADVLLCAVADGMGGVAGGSEASRTSLRALGSTVLDPGSRDALDARLAGGFRAAADRVHEHATAVPTLRDMGTTLTALCLMPGRALLGHVGDTRLYRLRAGEVELLTADHAVRHPDNVLTRCIGGGRAACDPDLSAFPTRPGDRFLLLTDGVWSLLGAEELAALGARGAPQGAAEELVRAALRAGGPDNATAVVVDVLAATRSTAAAVAQVPRDERPDARADWPRAVSLRPPLWPWLLFAAAVLLAAAAALHYFADIDLLRLVPGGHG